MLFSGIYLWSETDLKQPTLLVFCWYDMLWWHCYLVSPSWYSVGMICSDGPAISCHPLGILLVWYALMALPSRVTLLVFCWYDMLWWHCHLVSHSWYSVGMICSDGPAISCHPRYESNPLHFRRRSAHLYQHRGRWGDVSNRCQSNKPGQIVFNYHRVAGRGALLNVLCHYHRYIGSLSDGHLRILFYMQVTQVSFYLRFVAVSIHSSTHQLFFQTRWRERAWRKTLRDKSAQVLY